MIDINGLDKIKVLKALWDGSHCQGMSFFGELGLGGKAFDLERAQQVWDESPDKYFDYVYGHVLKVDLSGDAFSETLYDRDCGPGAAQKAIMRLRKEESVPVRCFDRAVCITIRETVPDQIIIGHSYYLNTSAIVKDPYDGEEYCDVYADPYGEHHIGCLSLKHFRILEK